MGMLTIKKVNQKAKILFYFLYASGLFQWCRLIKNIFVLNSPFVEESYMLYYIMLMDVIPHTCDQSSLVTQNVSCVISI